MIAYVKRQVLQGNSGREATGGGERPNAAGGVKGGTAPATSGARAETAMACSRAEDSQES
jgi:hypothetical protein